MVPERANSNLSLVLLERDNQQTGVERLPLEHHSLAPVVDPVS
jgi:hypothetical protein